MGRRRLPGELSLDGPKCEPGKDRGGADAAVTGYALLCFLGAGYDHRTPNQFQQTVKKGIDHLVTIQKANGSWGRNYENGVCTMALCEALAMSSDAALIEPAQRAVDHLISVQNPGAGKAATVVRVGTTRVRIRSGTIPRSLVGASWR